MFERQLLSDGLLLTVRRNCALSPRQLARAYAALAGFSLLIGGAAAGLGAWVVLPWTVVELSAVGLAFLWWGRHANDRECIHLGSLEVRVEVFSAGEVSRYTFNRQWVQLVGAASGSVEGQRRSSRLGLREHGKEVEVGRYLSQAGRIALARELRAALGQGR